MQEHFIKTTNFDQPQWLIEKDRAQRVQAAGKIIIIIITLLFLNKKIAAPSDLSTQWDSVRSDPQKGDNTFIW